MTKKSLVFLALSWTVAVGSVAQPAAATMCGSSSTNEQVVLKLDAVDIDGSPAPDLAPYDKAGAYTLAASFTPGGVRLASDAGVIELFAVEGGR